MPGLFEEGFSIPAPSESPAEGHEEDVAENLDPEDPYADDQDEEIEEADPEEESEEDPDEEDESDPDDGNSDPKLLAGKYKSVDELVNGYQNLQREFTKSRQPQGQQPGQQTPAQQVGSPEQTQQFNEMFQQNPLGTLQYLIENAVAARTAPINEQRETDVLTRNIESLSKEYKQVGTEEGMKQLFGKVSEIAQEMGNPNLAKNPTARVLRLAATEAFGDSKQTVYNKAKQEGRKEAEATRAAKKGLPAARTGAKTKVTNEQKLSPEDEIRQGIMAANGRGGRGLLG